MSLRISIRFGKRDQKRYGHVINWLQDIEEGWRSEAIKQALSAFISSSNGGQFIETARIPIDVEKTDQKKTAHESKGQIKKPISNQPPKPVIPPLEKDEDLEAIDGFFGQMVKVVVVDLLGFLPYWRSTTKINEKKAGKH